WETQLRRPAQTASIQLTAEEAVIGMSLDYCITHWNPGAQELCGYRSRDAAGQPQGPAKAPLDRTERKRAEDMLPVLMEAVPSAMVVADSQSKIVLVNTQTEKLFGFTREELIGRDVD